MDWTSLIEQINALGMKFGLWIEPEMVNENSQLYRTHPDWALTLPGRNPPWGATSGAGSPARRWWTIWQGLLAAAAGEHHIEYIKWDRTGSERASAVLSLPNNRKKAFAHRYMPGVYALAERLTQGFGGAV